MYCKETSESQFVIIVVKTLHIVYKKLLSRICSFPLKYLHITHGVGTSNILYYITD